MHPQLLVGDAVGATDPERGSHFHTGVRLAAMLSYPVSGILAGGAIRRDSAA